MLQSSESWFPTPAVLETLSAFHYQSLAIPSGVASIATHLADRPIAYGLAAAFGCLHAGVALPRKDYGRDFASMTWAASVFETDTPRLMRPRGRRLTLDHEGGYSKSIQDATGTGNLKSWFYIQEIPPGIFYRGAVFGPDPFSIASEIEGRPISEIIFRVGRHRGGVVKLTRGTEAPVRLNLHSGHVCGLDMTQDLDLRVEVPALWDMQISQLIDLNLASTIITSWMKAARTARAV